MLGLEHLYIVKKPFRLVEWGDSKGETENNIVVNPGSLLAFEVHSNGRIKNLWVDGSLIGHYRLKTPKSYILSFCSLL